MLPSWPSPRAPREPASAVRRSRRRRGCREPRRAAFPCEPQSPGFLFVPRARHASLSILGGDGRRYTAHAHRPTRGATRVYARRGRPIAGAGAAAGAAESFRSHRGSTQTSRGSTADDPRAHCPSSPRPPGRARHPILPPRRPGRAPRCGFTAIRRRARGAPPSPSLTSCAPGAD